MKTLYISSNGNIAVDTETNEVFSLSSERESISRLFVAPEPMHVVYNVGEHHKEFDVKKDDIIIKFYENTFTDSVVVAKSKEWVKNIKTYNDQQQKIKEEWAAAKAKQCLDCEESD